VLREEVKIGFTVVPCHRIVEIARAAARQIEVGIIFVAVLDAPRHEGSQYGALSTDLTCHMRNHYCNPEIVLITLRYQFLRFRQQRVLKAGDG
jgi:hypothetical protein